MTEHGLGATACKAKFSPDGGTPSPAAVSAPLDDRVRVLQAYARAVIVDAKAVADLLGAVGTHKRDFTIAVVNLLSSIDRMSVLVPPE